MTDYNEPDDIWVSFTFYIFYIATDVLISEEPLERDISYLEISRACQSAWFRLFAQQDYIQSDYSLAQVLHDGTWG